MGKRGVAPKPTALKMLEGGRADRINRNEPQPPADAVVAPDWLSVDARAVWDRLAPSLEAKGVLKSWDVDSFATLCCVVVESRDAHVDLAANGNRVTVVERELADGTIIYSERKNPNWQIAKEAAGMIVSLGGRFGLNPSDRSQLSIEPEAEHGKGKERLLS